MLLLAPPGPGALDALRIEVAGFEGTGWRSGPLEVTARLEPDGRFQLRATARRLSLPAPLDALREATFTCDGARWDGDGIHCPSALIAVSRGGAPELRLRGEVSLDTVGGNFSLAVRQQPVAGGQVTLDLSLSGDDAALRARLTALDLAPLAAAASLAGVALPVTVSAGSVSGDLELRRRGEHSRVDVALEVAGLAWSDAAGLRVGEALAGALQVAAQGADGALAGDLQLRVTSGLIYVDPVLLEVGDEAMTLDLEGGRAADGTLTIDALAFEDPEAGRLSGSARLNPHAPQPLQALVLELPAVAAARLYQRYLKPFAGVGALSDLDLRGEVSGRFAWQEGALVAGDLSLDALDLGDAQGRFALFGLAGNLAWRDRAPAAPSRLTLRGAQVYAVDLGATALDARLVGDRLHLAAPLTVPVLDGSLRIGRLEAGGLGADSQRLQADLVVEPLSLARLSDRLAWLPLAGSLSGRFPDLSYTDRRFAVNGDVQIRLFDGDVTVSNLTLDDPFGVVPRLQADLALRGIDLEVLTRAFSFGSIEGRLDGDVRGLVLEGWQPLAFDAVFETPPGDTSRHRISQRAVDNLASLGGANAVLSSTFLRIFQEFSYDRLGIRCRLEAGVCRMGGIAPADGGYYIVKGGGLPPRVDVVGFNSRVDWRTLVDRLKAVASTEGPVIR